MSFEAIFQFDLYCKYCNLRYNCSTLKTYSDMKLQNATKNARV